jgi:hypothetical protein
MNGWQAVIVGVVCALVVVLVAAARYGVSKDAVAAEARHEADRRQERDRRAA